MVDVLVDHYVYNRNAACRGETLCSPEKRRAEGAGIRWTPLHRRSTDRADRRDQPALRILYCFFKTRCIFIIIVP